MNILVEAYLKHLQEYEEVQIIDFCKSIECPRKRLMCLKLARTLLAPNLFAQRKVDREIDVLTNNFEGSGEIGDTFEGVSESSKPDYDADAPGDTGMASKNPPYDTQEVEIPDEDADKQQKKPLTWADGKKTYKIKEIFRLLDEAGFKHYPKGWTGKSVKKFSSSLVKGGAKPKGFFEKCVEKMRGKVANPEGFCAAAKDEVYKSTGWRGKDKTPAEVAKAIKKKQFKLHK